MKKVGKAKKKKKASKKGRSGRHALRSGYISRAESFDDAEENFQRAMFGRLSDGARMIIGGLLDLFAGRKTQVLVYGWEESECVDDTETTKQVIDELIGAFRRRDVALFHQLGRLAKEVNLDENRSQFADPALVYLGERLMTVNGDEVNTQRYPVKEIQRVLAEGGYEVHDSTARRYAKRLGIHLQDSGFPSKKVSADNSHDPQC